MLEDQVAYLLQRYLGNYVRGLNKEALKISVWKGDVELTNMQLKPEALNALKLPVKVKAGFLGSVKLKVPWSRLGQDPVLVYLDRIFLLAEPATLVEGCTEDAIQEAKRSRVREMEMKLLERAQQVQSEMNKSWLGSLISTIIGNLKLSISNIHIRYEDLESNPGHPFAAGFTLEKLLAVTVDDSGKETFVTGGALDHIQKSVELDQLAVYLDSDILPWHIDKPWEDLLPSEWVKVFRFGTKDGRPADHRKEKHTYILQPVTGNGKYLKLRQSESPDPSEPLQKVAVNLDDVTLCLSKDGYRDILKLADNFTAFNQRLKFAHYRPHVSLKSDPRAWWKYAYKAVSDQMKKASGTLSWEQVLRYTRLRKKYISLYASLLKSDMNRPIIDDNKEIEELDHELDIDLILQWRMLAHKFLVQSLGSENYKKQQKAKRSWWSFGRGNQSLKDESESIRFSEEDWEQLNRVIGYKEDDQSLTINEKPDILQLSLEVHMKHNASKLIDGAHACLAELSCEGLHCSIKLYPETKVFDLRLGSYQLSSPSGLLAESATMSDSLVGLFCYKPFDAKVDWSMIAKASPCYITYLKDPLDEVVKFFESNAAVSQTIALETAAALQMTIDEVKRSAQQQVNRALKDHSRFQLHLDIAAPKITIPTEFRPDGKHSTKFLLDLGNLVIRSQDDYARSSSEELDLYLQFDLVLTDVSAFLVDGDYHWSQASLEKSAAFSNINGVSFLPVIDRCGVILNLQQIRLENPSYPSTRLAVQLPSVGFHFSPARYHRLMKVIKMFQEDNDRLDLLRPWNEADFEGWLSVLSRKGVGKREAVWQRRYLCLVGPFLYVLESPGSKSYKQYISLTRKQLHSVPAEVIGDLEYVLAVSDAARSNNKPVVEDLNALILRCDSDDSRKAWQSCLQGAIYHASGSAPITSLSETSSDSETENVDKYDMAELAKIERIFITGVLDELKIRFSYNQQHEKSFIKVLLDKEYPLFEFRAIGGQVELSIKSNDMFIGTMLKSLEIEDLICCNTGSRPCYLARSFIQSADSHLLTDDNENKKFETNDLSPSGDDKFFEAPESLVESAEGITPTPQKASEFVSLQKFFSSEKASFMTPSFSRVPGLLPDDSHHQKRQNIEILDTLESFVKAQIVIYDQNSPLYDSIDMQVTVTLATLSLFCRRPTILAIMEFANAVTIKDESCESFSDISPSAGVNHDISSEDTVDNQQSTRVDESAFKSLLGKGKSRVIFNLTLNMAHAEFLLMNENETKLATLSQENLLTDIKVFPSSFSINAALGNLRISDDSLPSNHMYFWICDMRDPGGTSFVELVFTSFSTDDEDYEGFEYSLFGQLSEVRIVYLNRFVQEVISYFTGLVPKNSNEVVNFKDQVTNSENWFTISEIEGSSAVKLDLSLRKPIILMPRRTDSLDYLKLDVVHITVKNTFQWLFGSKSDLNAVHVEIMTIQVEDINLNVGAESDLSESIIKDVKGISIVIWRSLRDLTHQVPNVEAAIKIGELKAELSSREYQIVTECALSNISETPHIVPPLSSSFLQSTVDVVEPVIPQNMVGEPRYPNAETWTEMKLSVDINIVELCLYVGEARSVPLAVVQARGTWLLYKSNTLGEGFLSASLMGFTVIDNRVGTLEEFRLAIGMPKNPLASAADTNSHLISNGNVTIENDIKSFPTMLILDAKFGQSTKFVSLCVQRPQLLVALDFLQALVEFFVPTVGSMLLNEDDSKSLHMLDAVILDKSTFSQPSAQFSLSPVKPLIADDENFDHFIYDGNGGILHLKDREGYDLSAPSNEAIIYIGKGKKLQFRNVHIKNGQFLDSCISLGANSSYSILEDDLVYLDGGDEGMQVDTSSENSNDTESRKVVADRSAEFIIEFQVIGPELTFYSVSKDVGDSPFLSNKLLHGQLDIYGRLVLKGDTVEMTANALGLTMESNGIRILEPFDTSIKYSNASGKTNIHLSVSDIFMNFSFSILRLFLAVEEDILAFLRTASKEITVVCSQFDRVGTIRNHDNDQIYTFWRARAPVGFTVLGDYMTPLDKPPSKGVLAVNTNYVRVKRPVSFKQVWPPLDAGGISNVSEVKSYSLSNGILGDEEQNCTVWFPEAPEGYVALGCVVSPGKFQPSTSSSFCILASFVSPCSLRDCITISDSNLYPSSLAFWRIDNSLGTFLPAESTTFSLLARPYDLRCVIIGSADVYAKASSSSDIQASSSGRTHNRQSESSAVLNSGRRFEAVASFRLVWWNRGSRSRKQLSIWRPLVPEGMVYFGDIVVQGYEPPNTCVVLHDAGDGELFKAPLSFQLVGQIKKQRGMENTSFWLPQAPPGYVSLGCVANKGPPRQQDFCTLRCMRSDMVTGDQFLEESVFDTKFGSEPFSIWAVANELGTFFVRGGSRKPPKRFALKLADSYLHGGSDDTVIDAEIGTFSVALFDDYAGLMVPLFNISLSGIAFSLHGRSDYSNSTVSFCLAARSYNDKYESWEPIVEPVDGFLRYQYDPNAPGAASQLRFTSTRDLNLNISVSNANMIIQAYASWNNLSDIHQYHNRSETFSSIHAARSIIDVHHKRSHYIIPQNKTGQDIFIRATESRGFSDIIRMPSGNVKPVKVPVSKNMLDSHLKGKLCKKLRTMVTIIIADAMFPKVEGLTSHQYTVAVHLSPEHNLQSESLLHQQSARTCGRISSHLSSDSELVDWSEIFFFKVDFPANYTLELIVTDAGKGDAIGFFSAPLNQIAIYVPDHSHQYDYVNSLMWKDLPLVAYMNATQPDASKKKPSGKLKCAVILSPKDNVDEGNEIYISGRKSGVIQISPSVEGPWTMVRLNYAATAACWRLGNDVVACEVSVEDGNRYVNIRSLVSVHNKTDFLLDLRLVHNASGGIEAPSNVSLTEGLLADGKGVHTDEFFETENYDPNHGWVGCNFQLNPDRTHSASVKQATAAVEIPSGWEWIDDWHLDTSSNSTDGWIYTPDVESLKRPESDDSLTFPNYVRHRKWIRRRKQISVDAKEIFVGQLKPDDTMPLPLSGLSQSGLFVFQLRPSTEGADTYSWSYVVGKPGQLEASGKPKGISEVYLSALSESEELLCCTELIETSSNASSHKLWFCLSIQGTEISKGIHSDPILDWSLVVKSPVSITNYLPLTAEYSILETRASGHFMACSRGIFHPGETVNIYNADIYNPLFISLLPQRGWLPIHEVVLLSHPHETPSKTISLRSSISGRIVQLIIEQNFDREQAMMAKTIRVYAPYWFSVSRCPPLIYRLVDVGGKKHKMRISLPLHSKMKNEQIIEEISDEEMFSGHTIASALNFKILGLSVSIAESSNEHFGPVKDLSPLGDMDGSLEVYAYDANGKCMRLFVSTKPCPYQSVPTKVITVRPYMTFTNRLGQDLFIKLSNEDEPKILWKSDSRISFVHCENGGTDKLQVRLEDTHWSFPVQIVKEDTITLVLRRHDATRTFLKVEIRGYEEGSRFIVVFRLGSTKGPVRIENRTISKTVCIRQSGFDEYAWISIGPLSTTHFSWEDPYGQKLIDVKIAGDCNNRVLKVDLEGAQQFSAVERELGLSFNVFEAGNIKFLRFTDEQTWKLSSHEDARSLMSVGKPQIDVKPLEIIVELGIVGLSVVNHVPKEICYLFLDRVFISYSTGYDSGTTSRFKLILGHLQIDNQLPLTLMPVLLAPEQMSDIHHPVFKMTITMRNVNPDGIQVYPYVYIRVTDKCWRLNIHEPIIWALVDFYNNLQLDRIPQSSGVTEVDPEIRVDLIDVSEVRLKVSLETAPAQRPHEVLGVWSPILSAIGNALKIQVHLRRVMRKDRFMRRSSMLPAIGNRIWRDLIHNPLHLLFSVDVLGMTSSTLASLSKGFAELSTDGQFLQLRSKQVSSRRITGVGDGIVQGTEALAQGVAFGVSGVVRKPVESARENGILGLAHGIGHAALGFVVQPVSGALDFFSLTVDGIGASCSRCLEVLNSKSTFQRIRNPRAIHADGILREYSEKEATGQMVLFLAEASRHFGCTEIFKEPSKFALSDYYEDHFIVPYQKIVLVTNKRVMLLQCSSLDKMDKKPCKIIWDVPWEDLMALELAKGGSQQPSHLLLHLKNFKRSEDFVRVIKCSVEGVEGIEVQTVKICSVVRKMWKAHQSDTNSIMLKVPSSQRYVHFAGGESDMKASYVHKKTIIQSSGLSSSSSSDGTKFIERNISFTKIWSSERESKSGCALYIKQEAEDTGVCSIWRPTCPDGYVFIGDVAHVGSHPPNVAAVYRNIDKLFALPVGYDLVWRNCVADYTAPVSIWYPRAPEGFISLGCVAVAGFTEPEPDLVHCVAETIAEETTFGEQKIWSAPDSYPWSCHIYQVHSDALHFVALRESKEESDWNPIRVNDDRQNLLSLEVAP